MTFTDASAAPSWRVLVPSSSEIGERPVWDAQTMTLIWPDILAGRIHRSVPSANAGEPWLDMTVQVGSVVGAVALREDGFTRMSFVCISTTNRTVSGSGGETGRGPTDPQSCTG